PEDHRAVLAADVVALAHALRRVVRLPEHLQEVPVADALRVIDDEHGLGVAGAAGADLAVARIRGVAARITGRRDPDAVELPELPFDAPETAHREHRALVALGIRRRHRIAIDEVFHGSRLYRLDWSRGAPEITLHVARDVQARTPVLDTACGRA